MRELLSPCVLTAVQCTNPFLVVIHNLVSLCLHLMEKKECESSLRRHELHAYFLLLSVIKLHMYTNVYTTCIDVLGLYTYMTMAYLLMLKSTGKSVVSTGDSVIVLNASKT